MSENRAPAQYCPYCGETNLWPHEESHGAWSCRDCRRVFAVRFIGLVGHGNDSGNTSADGLVVSGNSTLPVRATGEGISG